MVLVLQRKEHLIRMELRNLLLLFKELRELDVEPNGEIAPVLALDHALSLYNLLVARLDHFRTETFSVRPSKCLMFTVWPHNALESEIASLQTQLAEAQAVAYALRANSRASTASVDVLVASLAQEVRSLEDEVRRARESEAIGLAAQLHIEKVMGAAVEQLCAEAAAAGRRRLGAGPAGPRGG